MTRLPRKRYLKVFEKQPLNCRRYLVKLMRLSLIIVIRYIRKRRVKCCKLKQVSANGMLEHGDLEARSGPIQAAINLEITTEKISHINVKINGLNGQLPNLDLVNLVYRLCMREGVHQMFQGVEDHPRPDSWKGYTRYKPWFKLILAGLIFVQSCSEINSKWQRSEWPPLVFTYLNE